MSRDTTAPAGNGGHRTIISRHDSTPSSLSRLLAGVTSNIKPWTQETQEEQEEQEEQDSYGDVYERTGKQETQRVPSPREKESCVSCVNLEEGGTRSLSRGEEDPFCASCVKQPERAPDSDFQNALKQAAERSAEDVLKHRDRADGFRSPSLLFARCLKANPVLSGLDAEAATERIDQELDLMFPDHPAPWVALGLLDFDSRGESCDPRSDFLAAWERVTTPFQPGWTVQEAARAARENPLDLGDRFTRPADAAFRQLLALCYRLGESTGGEFFLSCRVIGDVLNVSPTTASQLCRRAEAAGFLEPVGTYTEKDRAQRRAKSWRFKAPDPLGANRLQDLDFGLTVCRQEDVVHTPQHNVRRREPTGEGRLYGSRV